MAVAYVIFVCAVIGWVSYRIIRNKSSPANGHAPYDDITTGRQGQSIHYSKEPVEYIEKRENVP